MNKRMHCATCGTFVDLSEQTVSCPKCQTSGDLASAILALMAQAGETGRKLDVQSVQPDNAGKLTYRLEPQTKRRAQRSDVA